MRFQAFVDGFWADALGISVTDLHQPGFRLLTDAPAYRGHERIHVIRIGETVLVSAPEDAWPFGVALGPSQHAYLHRDDFAGSAAGIARRVTEADAAAVDAFRRDLGDDDFAEGGFGEPLPDVSWAVFDGGRIVAMGNMTDFAGAPADVGLATLPSARGTGLATRLALDMLAGAFTTVEVARYRAVKSNRASLAIAARLGFTPYGENVVIRPA